MTQFAVPQFILFLDSITAIVLLDAVFIYRVPAFCPQAKIRDPFATFYKPPNKLIECPLTSAIPQISNSSSAEEHV